MPPPELQHYPRCIAELHSTWQLPFHQRIREGTGVDFQERLRSAPLAPEEKLHWVVSRRLGALFARNACPESRKCGLCWVGHRACYCARAPRVATPHRFFVYMHFKEFQRVSNTGKLLLLGLDGECLIMGVEHHERRLRDLCVRPNTCVVYPDPGSMTVWEFHERLCAGGPAVEGAASASEGPAPGTVPAGRALERARADGPGVDTEGQGRWPEPTAHSSRSLLADPAVPMNFIFLDSTWPQARTLVNRLPRGVPYVRLSPPAAFKSLLHGLRKQSQWDRVSTLEAGVLLLHEMGLPAAVGHEFDALLKYHVDLVRFQTHQASCYGTYRPAATARVPARVDGVCEAGPAVDQTLAERDECAGVAGDGGARARGVAEDCAAQDGARRHLSPCTTDPWPPPDARAADPSHDGCIGSPQQGPRVKRTTERGRHTGIQAAALAMAPPAVCKHWRAGHCRRGDACGFLHPVPPVTQQVTDPCRADPLCEVDGKKLQPAVTGGGDAVHEVGLWTDCKVDMREQQGVVDGAKDANGGGSGV